MEEKLDDYIARLDKLGIPVAYDPRQAELTHTIRASGRNLQ